MNMQLLFLGLITSLFLTVYFVIYKNRVKEYYSFTSILDCDTVFEYISYVMKKVFGFIVIYGLLILFNTIILTILSESDPNLSYHLWNGLYVLIQVIILFFTLKKIFFTPKYDYFKIESIGLEEYINNYVGIYFNPKKFKDEVSENEYLERLIKDITTWYEKRNSFLHRNKILFPFTFVLKKLTQMKLDSSKNSFINQIKDSIKKDPTALFFFILSSLVSFIIALFF